MYSEHVISFILHSAGMSLCTHEQHINTGQWPLRYSPNANKETYAGARKRVRERERDGVHVTLSHKYDVISANGWMKLRARASIQCSYKSEFELSDNLTCVLEHNTTVRNPLRYVYSFI